MDNQTVIRAADMWREKLKQRKASAPEPVVEDKLLEFKIKFHPLGAYAAVPWEWQRGWGCCEAPDRPDAYTASHVHDVHFQMQSCLGSFYCILFTANSRLPVRVPISVRLRCKQHMPLANEASSLCCWVQRAESA